MKKKNKSNQNLCLYKSFYFVWQKRHKKYFTHAMNAAVRQSCSLKCGMIRYPSYFHIQRRQFHHSSVSSAIESLLFFVFHFRSTVKCHRVTSWCISTPGGGLSISGSFSPTRESTTTTSVYQGKDGPKLKKVSWRFIPDFDT